MIVILAEKPSVARDIARVLGANNKKDGWIEGNGYQVTWAFGHLITIDEPERMFAAWGGKWNFAQLPMIPDEFKLTANKSSLKQFTTISNLFNNCNAIINATDAGREGELIFRWIYKHCKCQKPFKRLWISDLTDESIKTGFSELLNGQEFDNLGQSAQCRAFSDWMVGLNATRAYSIKYGQLYTVGRVQTPTLALIVERDKLINGFEKVYYYELYALVKEVSFRWENQDSYKIDSEKQASDLKQKLENKPGEIIEIKKSKRKTAAPTLYDLTLLQKECNEKFGFTAQQTLDIAQDLYEKHKLISYPRTESRHLSEKMRPQLPNVLKNAPQDFKDFADLALSRLSEGLKLSKNYIDDKKLTDHHAIIPTNKKLAEQLPVNHKNVYLLIFKRFIAIFLSENIEDITCVTMMIENETLKTRTSSVSDLGWKVIYSDIDNKDEEVVFKADAVNLIKANFKKGQKVDVDNLEIKQKETTPPKPFTDGTLLNAMKFVGRQVDDDLLAAQLKDQGLGTQATRAAIIERLIKSEYIFRKGKNIFPTEKGIKLIDIVVPDLKSPELTAQWETKLSEIKDGKINDSEFMKEIKQFTIDIVSIIKNDNGIGRGKNFGNCPKCKKGKILEGKKSSFYCSDYKSGCKFVFWGTIAGKKLTNDEIEKIIKEGQSDFIQGFKSKVGKLFDARIKLDENFKTKFFFDKIDKIEVKN